MIGDEVDAHYGAIIDRQICNIIAICKYIAGGDYTNMTINRKIACVSIYNHFVIEMATEEDYEEHEHKIKILCNTMTLIQIFLGTLLHPVHSNNKLCNDLLVIQANLIMILLEKLPNAREFVNDAPDLASAEFNIEG